MSEDELNPTGDSREASHLSVQGGDATRLQARIENYKRKFKAETTRGKKDLLFE